MLRSYVSRFDGCMRVLRLIVWSIIRASTVVSVLCFVLAYSAFSGQELQSVAGQVFMLDLSTSSVLFEKNANSKMPPSSMTKILTAYLLLEAIKNGDIALEDDFIVSEEAAKQPGTSMFLKSGQSVKVIDLLKGIVVSSANDACVVVSEILGGSEKAFADLMNNKAKELGALNSNFVNASGLPDSAHYSTCRDLAMISRRLINDFSGEYARYFSMQEFSFNGIKQRNRNMLLKNGFLDGVKTGKTDLAKCGMVASSVRGGRRLLLVVNGIENESKRAQEVSRLMNYGFSCFLPIVVFEKGAEIEMIPVWRGDHMAAVSQSKISFSIPKRLKNQIKVRIKYLAPLVPPISKGQKIGNLTVTIPGAEDREFPIIASEDARENGVMSWIMHIFGMH
ncbi:D-alanyl-D-alanine carboxypeptidase family protein [Candidatus Hydrogenosomobacter endosymbioticus]|uniref:serine-type D-Ala-D-Ala carboxypeptidase n=1 Tax=Candidatus Hydrogenosomobacter endosymbioticus TaxID=2558174 RepID=A0ABN6L3C1_9PROT|nr:D-alanyl-D-alanine carboxypeptidase family protein [Candidatus Hydrogenosomobacter endosymbioticus]BDB96433.1 D-alanyl-D-alanine carboxypeptidase [Candidatus Hydrogenosomobacter endosymbioticus]